MSKYEGKGKRGLILKSTKYTCQKHYDMRKVKSRDFLCVMTMFCTIIFLKKIKEFAFVSEINRLFLIDFWNKSPSVSHKIERNKCKLDAEPKTFFFEEYIK